ncbi:uncharacterized protein LOC119169241 [Rhipicephalus microplus]|uniref:uncharacterized protein LOC119169241 n=1 Tax=Rhipicephalus microplus TaxID=6941 RepID=UPI003F6BD4F2
MRPSCCICMETIHASSSSSDGNSVSATECGHVFHDVCLRRWLTTSNSCPTCRKQLHDEKIVKLFLDGADLLPDGCIRNEGGPLRLIQRQLCVARSQLEEAAAVEKRQAEEAHALRGNVRRLEGVARTYNSKYVNMMRENGRLRSQLRYLREEVKDRRILRRENSALRNELCSKERQLAISEEIRKRMDHAMGGLRVQLDQREALLQQQVQQIQALQEGSHHQAEFTFQSIQWPLPSWSDRSDDSPQSGLGPAPKRPRL